MRKMLMAAMCGLLLMSCKAMAAEVTGTMKLKTAGGAILNYSIVYSSEAQCEAELDKQIAEAEKHFGGVEVIERACGIEI